MIYRNNLVHLVTLFGLFFISYQSIFNSSFLERDDLRILEHVQTVKEHLLVGDFNFNQWLDAQPVRDVILMLVGEITETPFGYKFLSLVLAYLLYLLLFIVFEKLEFNSYSAIYASILILHPSNVHLFSWIAAQKHLFAIIFALSSLIFILNNKTYLSIIAYALSIFSQPITLPLGLYIVCRQKNKKIYFSIGALASVCVILNLIYYSYYAKNDHHPYLLSTDFYYVTLAFGRFFTQLLFPIKQSVNYDEQSPLNLIGLLLAGAIFLILKKEHRKFAYLSLFFLYPILTSRYGLFYSDTYGVLTSFVLLPLILNKVNKKHLPYLFIFLTFFNLYKSKEVYRSYENNINLFEYGYQQEPSSYNLVHYVQHKKKLQGDFFIEEVETRGLKGDHSKAWGTVMGRSIFLSSSKNKMLLFQKYYVDDPWYRYFGVFSLTPIIGASRALELIKDDMNILKKDPSVFKDLKQVCRMIDNNHQVCSF